eukprot:Hpha_TRINITY_DN34271_c0_g1::TRINITY_DN34271_c0_g1_i1::g.34352::m.34352/K10587/UBE3A, E6AP; ubiquitin-protein ligase E3 A
MAGDGPVVSCNPDKRVRLLDAFKAHVHLMQQGCGDATCRNTMCKSSPQFEHQDKSPHEQMEFIKTRVIPGCFASPSVWHVCESMWQPYAAAHLPVATRDRVEKELQQGNADELAALLTAGTSLDVAESGQGDPVPAWLFLDVGLMRGDGNRFADRAGDAVEQPRPGVRGAEFEYATAREAGGHDSKGGNERCRIPAHVRVRVLESDDHWCKIEWKRDLAYVKKTDLVPVPPQSMPNEPPLLALDIPAVQSLWERTEQLLGAERLAGILRAMILSISRFAKDDGRWAKTLRGEYEALQASGSRGRRCLNEFLTWRLARMFAVLFESDLIRDPYDDNHFGTLCGSIVSLRHFIATPLALIWSRIGAEAMALHVERLHTFICIQMHATERITDSVSAAARVLGIFYEASHLARPEGLIPYQEFYNQTANGDVSAEEDYLLFLRSRPRTTINVLMQAIGMSQSSPPLWKAGIREGPRSLAQSCVDLVREDRQHPAVAHAVPDPPFCFLLAPYTLGSQFKLQVLQLDASRAHEEAAREIYFMRSGQVSEEDLYLVLHIDRGHVMASALQELMRKGSNIRRELRVKFVTGGREEEGVDEGGVRKEFFQLLTKELFDPAYGMFSCDPATRVQWFQPRVKCGADNDLNFHLCGLMLGLAIRHNILLDVNFPIACYKRLLDIDPTFNDIEQLDLQVFRSLKQLLEFREAEGTTVEDTFCRNFSVSHEAFGAQVEEELIPGGREIALTGANRRDFVDAYTRYLCFGSIEKHFQEFYNGFWKAVGAQGPHLRTFRPEELELAVIGSPILDMSELQRTARYEGYTKDHRIVVEFWELLKDMDTETHRSFLKFATGSDRVPVGGLATLQLVIGKNGDDSERLPTAHTCFNHLLIPEYLSKEKLRQKLLSAVSNCQGFGLM